MNEHQDVCKRCAVGKYVIAEHARDNGHPVSCGDEVTHHITPEGTA